jgi:nickel-dependent lactate racemase
MNLKLKYGDGYREFTLPDDANVTVMQTRAAPVVADARRALLDALAAPLGTCPLEAMPHPASVAIAVPDETRPTPLKALLPPLLERLCDAFPALKKENIAIVVGGGLHPAPDAAQLGRILPEAARGCRIIAHDALSSPVTRFGATSRGTPVEINADYAAAELKIVIGQIDPHQFVGFTGGSKGVTIGLASKAMIQHNHGLMSRPGARVGEAYGNPVRQDLDEAGEMIGIDLAVNVVLNPEKQIVALLAGKPRELVRPGSEVAARVYGLPIAEPFDIVIAACGGHPKDICLYQAQKGLNLASECARENGKILLLAACAQGVGDELYHDYVRRFSSPQAQLRDFEEGGFRMGAHKAFLFSRTVTRFEVVVVSELDAATLAGCHLTKGPLQATLDRWLAALPASARIAVVPHANTTYFYRLSNHDGQ